MKRVAFKMHLFEGVREEYQKRHDEIWPELKELLKQYGVSDYSLFLDETTNDLFGIMTVADADKMKDLPQEPVMKRWWEGMSKLMDSHPDNSPKQVDLKEVFYLP